MQTLLERQDLAPETMPWAEVMEHVMYQCAKEDRCDLPETGMPWEVEHQLSSIFILPTELQGRPYGTQTQTVVAGWREGLVDYREKGLHSVVEQATSLPKQSAFRVPVEIGGAWHLPFSQGQSC